LHGSITKALGPSYLLHDIYTATHPHLYETKMTASIQVQSPPTHHMVDAMDTSTTDNAVADDKMASQHLQLPTKNKGRSNHTVGYFYSMAPAVVVSEAPKLPFPCRNSTEPTRMDLGTNDGQSQTPETQTISNTNHTNTKMDASVTTSPNTSTKVEVTPRKVSPDSSDRPHNSPQSVVRVPAHLHGQTSCVSSAPQVIRSTSCNQPEPTSTSTAEITSSPTDGDSSTNTNTNTNTNTPTDTDASTDANTQMITTPSPQTQMKRVKIERNYDMNLVPKINKNPEFLKAWRKITLADVQPKDFSQIPSTFSLPSLVPCDHSCEGEVEHENDQEHDHDGDSQSANDNDHDSEVTPSASCDTDASSMISRCGSASSASSSSSTGGHDNDNVNDTGKEPHRPCHVCLVPMDTTALSPFGSNFESVIWAPRTRLDWEESIDEMVSVCTAAAWHKHRSKSRRKSKSNLLKGQASKKRKEFHPPISRIYIRDRIEIDDPLRGYQIRHKVGGWLQGFVMMTNFTTWTHYFKWDSMHPSNGIDRNTNGKSKSTGVVDEDGSFAEGLERQPRSGDPLGEGVVWPTIAEIGLVGALGCGEYLLQMALDDIARRGTYDYVVLEATDMSRPFYEKFGFVRVGAVCKYGNEQDVKDANGEVQDVGYRHWTYATETEQRLNEHGAPSCMMARRIKKFNPDVVCDGCERIGTPSFVDQLGRYFVLEKPKILSLGATRRKRSMTGANVPATKKAKTSVSVTSSGRKSKIPSRLEEEPDDQPRSKSRKSSLNVKKDKSESAKPRRNSVAPKKERGSVASDKDDVEANSRVGPSRTSKNSSLTPIAPLDKEVLKAKGRSNKPILLRKQKIPTMYRSPKKLYFYNKVVTPKSTANASKYKSKYYFVISFDMEAKSMSLIPLYLKGTFKGKREGRPKWKANVLPRNNLDEDEYLESMDVVTSTPVSEWNIVKSYAVTKCASVQEESWDVLA
jgi:hypothetical protein